MSIAETERLHPLAMGLDALPGAEVLDRLLDAQQAAVASVRSALPAIEAGAACMAGTLVSGGRLVYAGAGSSALMAVADGLELSGTYGIPPDRIRLLMAGGLPRDSAMPGATEDDTDEAATAAADIAAPDCVIAVAASGRTPYPLTVARIARARGATVIAIANNPGTPLLAEADVAICLPTPPELIAGSTRMGAGTAQKAALNLMSTLMAVRLGAVHDGMMVNLVADNAKLRQRARGIVATIAGVDGASAAAALTATSGNVKAAILVARGLSPDAAARTLAECEDNLRAALARIETTGSAGRHHHGNQGV